MTQKIPALIKLRDLWVKPCKPCNKSLDSFALLIYSVNIFSQFFDKKSAFCFHDKGQARYFPICSLRSEREDSEKMLKKSAARQKMNKKYKYICMYSG
jgi:hypothetical protein